jgi:hypothetical protein
MFSSPNFPERKAGLLVLHIVTINIPDPPAKVKDGMCGLFREEGIFVVARWSLSGIYTPQ